MHIAILEDEYILAQHTQDLLQNAQHTAEIFTSGKALLKALQRQTFDMLVLDWNVPDLSGIRVLQHVREELNSAIPVLFLTSRQFEQEIVYALTCGADDYCAKPLRENEFMARIAALGRRAYKNDGQNTSLQKLTGYTFNRLDNTVQWTSQGMPSRNLPMPTPRWRRLHTSRHHRMCYRQQLQRRRQNSTGPHLLPPVGLKGHQPLMPCVVSQLATFHLT